jgi:hypothetical protein
MKYIALSAVILLFSCKTDEKPLPASPTDAAVLSVFNELVFVKGFEEGLFASNQPGQEEVVVSKILVDTMDFAQVMRLSSNLQKTLSATDSLYIVQQLHEKKNLNMGRPFTVKSIYIGDPDILAKKQEASLKKDGLNGFAYYRFSKPFLTAGGNKAIIIEEYDCPNCGWGIALILEKKNNYWITVEEISLWIS